VRRSAAIVGIGETPYVRRSQRSLTALVIEAVEKALADAGLAGSDVDMIITEGGLMPTAAPPDEVARCIGVTRSYSVRTAGTYGAGIAGAHLAAKEAIESRSAAVVLSYFGVDWGSHAGAFHGLGGSPGSMKYALERPTGLFVQPVLFAAMANRYKHVHGVDLEPALGRLAVELRAHALANGSGQLSKPLTFDDYLAAPFVAEPLRVPDCCLLTDGAGATVTVGSDRARDLRQVPVDIRGGAFSSSPDRMSDFFTQSRGYPFFESARIASRRALELSGMGLGEMDFVQLYDCFTISLLLQMEDIGLCEQGSAVEYIGSGDTVGMRNSDTPINTHGGLLSHAYVLGIAHVIEAVRQLRGTAGTGQVPDAVTGLVGLLTGSQYCAIVLGQEAS